MPPSRPQPSTRRPPKRIPASSRRRGHPEIPGPPVTERALFQEYAQLGLSDATLKNPKEQIHLYVRKVTAASPNYFCEEVVIEGREYWRATIYTEPGSDAVVGVGDNPSKREAERLAALSALLQLSQSGKYATVMAPGWTPPPIAPTMSDGTVLEFDRARVFMDFYCQKFEFEAPQVDAREFKGRWEAVMSVGGSRIGIGHGVNKKLATTNCYLDVVAYLDKSDPDLWKTFLEETKGRGDAVGLAPTVYLTIGSRLTEHIRELTGEVKNSELYRKSPLEVVAAPETNDTMKPVNPRSLDEDFHRDKSAQLLRTLDTFTANPEHSAIREQRQSLPIYTRAAELLELVESQDVTICMAATGSGKTTQIPQIILDDWIQRGEGSKCNIVCTQPRRIAAISVAERVAKERGQNAGSRSQVGYQVRFDAKLPQMHGSVTFCTTGIFLKRMQTALAGETERSDDRSLDDITHIIIDEVHERDVDTDLTLAVVKRLLKDRRARNKPVKIILMSATIDPTLFQSYFKDVQGNEAKVIDIPGRSFPVEKRFLEDIVHDLAQEQIAGSSSQWVLNDPKVGDYLGKEVGHQAIAQLRHPAVHPHVLTSQHSGSSGEDLDIPYPLVALTVAHVIRKSENGHVLVFLPGWDEIQAVSRILTDHHKFPLYGINFADKSKYSIHLLHSTIPVAEQQQVFEPAAPGVRRIILATNIAETSITIPDVVYVVDTGKVKEKRYDPERHMSSLVSAWVGTSNLNQRAGRAGRHRPGEYYGLVSRARLADLSPNQLVEMKRADLSNVVMHVKALDFRGMDVAETFASLIEPPAVERVEAALETLEMVGALTSKEELTPLGRVLLQIPIDATLGRMVLFGAFFKCLDPALTLAAVLSNREPFNSPPALKQEAAAAKMSFSPEGLGRSDPLAAVRAYDLWWELQGQGKYGAANEFCNRMFLSKPVLLMVAKVKLALLQALQQCGVLEAAMGGKRVQRSREDPRLMTVPDELNINKDSLAVLGSLIAIGSQPNFAVRTSERTFRTYQDKSTIIHPSSTNATVTFRAPTSAPRERESWERFMVAFVEKSRNVAAGQKASSATTFLRNVTRLDNLQYLLFGAYKVKPTPDGIQCDDWLPIIGGARGSLTQIVELKTAFEQCMQRVFEGIHAANVAKRQARIRHFTVPSIEADADRDAEAANEQELEEEDDEEEARRRKRHVATPLSHDELLELGFLSRDVVRVLDGFNEDRRLYRMRSRPGTPTSASASTRASPAGGSGRARLPEEGGSAFARALRGGVYGGAGTGSPLGGRSPMPSRPSTPGLRY